MKVDAQLQTRRATHPWFHKLALVGALAAASGFAMAQSTGQSASAGLGTTPSFDVDRPALRLALSKRAQLIYEPRSWQPADVPDLVARRNTEAHVSLQFQSPRASGPRNLFRLQLSGGGVMQFRPRGGGLTVRYQAQF